MEVLVASQVWVPSPLLASLLLDPKPGGAPVLAGSTSVNTSPVTRNRTRGRRVYGVLGGIGWSVLPASQPRPLLSTVRSSRLTTAPGALGRVTVSGCGGWLARSRMSRSRGTPLPTPLSPASLASSQPLPASSAVSRIVASRSGSNGSGGSQTGATARQRWPASRYNVYPAALGPTAQPSRPLGLIARL